MYLGNRSIELIDEGKTVLFAFEEAIGFMFSSTVLDKDGVSAGAHLATLASYLKDKFNRSLSEQLDEIYKIYGFHCTKTSYYFCYDPNITYKMFQRIRNIKGDGKVNLIECKTIVLDLINMFICLFSIPSLSQMESIRLLKFMTSLLRRWSGRFIQLLKVN